MLFIFIMELLRGIHIHYLHGSVLPCCKKKGSSMAFDLVFMNGDNLRILNVLI